VNEKTIEEINAAFLEWSRVYGVSPDDPENQDDLTKYMIAVTQIAFQAGWLSHQRSLPKESQ
jgi:hypothetical protein